MSHLPKTDSHQNQRLDNRPPQDSLIGAFAGLPEALFTVLEKENRVLLHHYIYIQIMGLNLNKIFPKVSYDCLHIHT